jgi:hypothetical protein
MRKKARILSLLALVAAAALAQFAPPGPAKPPAPPVVQPAPALAKYRACYENQNPAIQTTLARAQEVLAKLAADGFATEGLYCNPVNQTAAAELVGVEYMVADGFPKDQPFNLLVKGAVDYHNLALIDKQLSYGWGYWFFYRYALRWGW